MNRRVLILLLLVVVLAAVVVLVVLPAINPPATPTGPGGGGPAATAGPTATPLQLSEVIVAVQQLPRGIRIPDSALAARLWPKASIPERAR